MFLVRGLGRLAWVAVVAAVTVPVLPGPVALAESGTPVVGSLPVPAGYRVESRTELAPGVERYELVADDPMVVNVARIARDAPVSFRAVLSNEQVAGAQPRLERTSSMCARVRCLLALNGDFAAVGSDVPIGGLVTAGQLERSPSGTHHQLSITRAGELLAGSFEWHGTLVPTDLRPLKVEGVNVDQGENRVVLYTPAFGPTTLPVAAATAIEIKMVEPAGPLRLGQTTMVELVGLREGALPEPIPAGGGLLSGQGKGADELGRLWERVQAGTAGGRALLRLETPADVVESLGGSPVLLREGKRWFADAGDNFTQGRHPRTIVGWSAATGDTFLVTVDGRQAELSLGMTLAQATDLMIALGATEAINLDGGGSTTFVQSGSVVNSPSDVVVRGGSSEVIKHSAGGGDQVIGHVERPVASALALVPSNEVAVPVADPLAGLSFDLPQALALPAAEAADPGSIPGGALPALISEPAPDLTNVVRAGAAAANVVVAVCLLLLWRRRRLIGLPGLS